jgi:hypothetical protein
LRVAEANSERLAQLASLAIPLLDRVCPVCGQQIEPGDVAHRLQDLAGDTRQLDKARSVATAARESANLRRRDLLASESALALARTREERLRQLREREADLLRDLSTLSRGTERFEFVASRQLDNLDAYLDPDCLSAVLQLEQAAEQLVLVLGAADEAERVQELRGQLSESMDAEQHRQRRLEELSIRDAAAKHLVDATIEARVVVSQRRVHALAPLVANIYSRLDPHPAFKTLQLDHEVYRAQGTTVPMATDELADRSAYPALVFSSSQSNVAALSIFLALSLGAGEVALPFVLLDDPLQSLDDVNVLGFADLCRLFRDQRQLIVSTHDRRFAGLLERKLAPRRADQRSLVVAFTGWDRSGPTMDVRSIEPQLNLPFLVSA